MVLCMHSYLVATTRLARLPTLYGSSLFARLVITSLSTRCCVCCVDVQALRAAHLDLQLAQAAVDGAPWAACDLAGLPLGASDAQLQACKDRWVPGGKNCCELRASLGGGGSACKQVLVPTPSKGPITKAGLRHYSWQSQHFACSVDVCTTAVHPLPVHGRCLMSLARSSYCCL